MTTQTLSPQALDIINSYRELPFSGVKVPCPYVNNRRTRVRGGLRAVIGKGSPKEIVEEAIVLAHKQGSNLAQMTAEQLTVFLVDHGLGIDCSGLAYYSLNEETQAQGKKPLKHHLFFPTKTFLRKLITGFRPIENTSVKVLTHEKNSQAVALADVKPGDMIIMLSAGPSHDRDHVMVVHAVESDNSRLKRIHYTHTFQWRFDGKYNHGVRAGEIDIIDNSQSITQQRWSEQGKEGVENETLQFARTAERLTLRRLKALATVGLEN